MADDRSYGESPAAARREDPAAPLTHQERVYFEMFRAIELLGRKLERSEAVREDLSRRLADLETGAARDAETGKLYLPARVAPAGLLFAAGAAVRAQRLTFGAALAALAFGIVALGFALAQHAPQTLSPRQLAVLNALADKPAVVAAFAGGTSLAAPNSGKPETAPTQTAAQTAQTETGAPSFVLARALEDMRGNAINDAPAPPAAVLLSEAPTVVEPPVVTLHETAATVPPPPAPMANPEAAQAASSAPLAEEPAQDRRLPAVFAALERRAYDGVAEAQHDLAALYAAGTRVRQDYPRAAYWFRRAAQGGIANAWYNLGVMAGQGMGMPRDAEKAFAHYQQAARLGHPEAMYNLGLAYIEGRGTARDTRRGMAFFKRAANAGLTQAAYNLGVLYEGGTVPGHVDVKSALEWYYVAASEGHEDARRAITRLERQQLQAEALTLADKVEPAAGAAN